MGCRGGIKVRRCTRQGKGGSSHSLRIQVPVLNGTLSWDPGFQANHNYKCFISLISGLVSRILPALVFQSKRELLSSFLLCFEVRFLGLFFPVCAILSLCRSGTQRVLCCSLQPENSDHSKESSHFGVHPFPDSSLQRGSLWFS